MLPFFTQNTRASSAVGAMLTKRILTFNVNSVSRKLTAVRDALKTPASNTCLSVVCLPQLVLQLALFSSGFGSDGLLSGVVIGWRRGCPALRRPDGLPTS